MENTSVPLLLLLALPVFFLALGANAIWDANEAFYVETPRQMLLSGDYVNPTFNDAGRFNKPVLSYWIVAGLYHLFGVSVGVERLGIAIGAMGILLAAFLVGRALRSTATGLLAALIVATAPRVVMFSRRIFIDVYITMFMSMALACFVLALRHPDRRRLWLVLMYVAIGLGWLTKGPVALVLPAAVCFVWLVAERRLGDLRQLMIVPGLAIVAALVAAWHVPDFLQNGWEHIRQFYIGENLDRFTTAMASDQRGPWFYLPVLLGDLFPWAPLLLVPLFSAWRPRQPGEDATSASIRRLLWIWIVVIVGGFTLGQTKQDLYIFPVVTAVAALVADAIVASDFGATRRALRAVIVIVAALSVAVAGATVWLFTSGYYAFAGAWAVAAALGAAGAVTIVSVLAGRHRTAVFSLAAGFIAFNYVFVTTVLPDVERFKPVPAIAATFRARATPDAKLGEHHLSFPSLVYYADHPVTEIGTPEHAAAFFTEVQSPGVWVPAWAMMDQARFDEVRARVPFVCVAERRPRLDAITIRAIVTRAPPADALLVTNQCQ